MAAYAQLEDVKSRAGSLAVAFGENTDPALQDIETWLADVAAEIDAAVAGLGFDVPVENETAARALLGLNADGALILALEGRWPEEEGNRAASALLKAVRARFDRNWLALLDGKHPAITALTAGGEAAIPSAGSTWDDRETTDEDTLLPWPLEVPGRKPVVRLSRLPAFRRGEVY